MDKQFFPERVAAALVEDWMWEKPVREDEEEIVSNAAAAKRLREFRAGRHCAHQVLDQLGRTGFSLLRGDGGEPLWPESVCGSISHSGERCVVIAAHKRDYLSVAVDVEKNRVIKPDTLDRVAHPQEQEMLSEMIGIPAGVNRAAILFSIKECIHKIYYPLNKHTLDFKDVMLSLGALKNSFDVELVNPAQEPAVDVARLSGKFGYDEDYVWSRICLRPDMGCD